MTQTSLALQPILQELSQVPSRIPPIPWRDPHTVSPVTLAAYIQMMEAQCGGPTDSADLRTCLGMAYAMNFDIYRSLDSFEAAVQIDPSHFFAKLKYSELLYRIRTLHRAEEETLRALELANNGWELSLARAQLKEIRRLLRKGNERPAMGASWHGPAFLAGGAAVLFGLALIFR
jgi:hypothetical protein